MSSPHIEVVAFSLPPGHARAKRTFDVAAASFGLVLFSPLMLVAAFAVRFSSPGPILFKQERVGLNGTRIRVWKFRTMIDGAEALSRETAGTHDPRITKVGSYLRRTKVDELPQLFNVLRGDMSMVGPRPEIPFYADQYSGDDRVVLSVRPGITDPSTLEMADLDGIMQSRGDESPAEFYVRVIQPRKLRLQKTYIRHQSLTGDIAILLRTLGKIAGR